MTAAEDDGFAAPHAAQDARTLVALYTRAADGAAPAAEAFYLTQAYVIALEAGSPTDTLLRRLQALGAEP